MKIDFTPQINNLMLQMSFSILIGHHQLLVTDFVLFSQKCNSIPSASGVYFIRLRRLVFVDRNGVSFAKNQAASYLLHLSGYLQ